MPVVISNTSPLQYLHQTEMLLLLSKFYMDLLHTSTRNHALRIASEIL